eukprot:TRINITY_DN23124_c0_g2_i2.p1 TRINITY_DN23124_c0_g2~~TRINITY_DN23124_c0_g2_i2.p1  ORF type:complete len:276 (+),score=41.68 TRINITY_DN23124_c0_g2_i2:159-986(+)
MCIRDRSSTMASTSCSQFIDPASGGLTNSSTVDCGVLMTCSSSHSLLSSGNHLGDSIIVTASSGALTAACGGSVRLSGVVYASVPFTQAVFQSYALLSTTTSLASVSPSAAADAFKSTPSQWYGSPSAPVVGVAGTSTIYLIGDASSSTSAPIAERYMAPILASNVSTTADLTSTGGSTSFCALPDQAAYPATFVTANASVVEGGVATSCFTFDSVDGLHAACQATSSCIGFSTVRVHQRELSLIHISEPTRLLSISYAVFCLKKKKKQERIIKT